MTAPPPAPSSTRPHWSARLSAWQRQAIAVPTAVVVGSCALRLFPVDSEIPWLAGWLAYSISYLAVVWRLAAHLDAEGTRRRAQWIDPGAHTLFVLVAAAACASVVAVALAVDTSRTLYGAARWGHIALAICALAASWLLLQTVFALHYAHAYYGHAVDAHGPARGLAFPGGVDPDYLDFLYFAAVVGMTSQVSDVAVTNRPMRRLTLVHGLLSFGFNLVLLALAINVVAGSLGQATG